MESKYFYLNDKTIDGDIIFNNINNVKYIPEFDTEDKEIGVKAFLERKSPKWLGR